MYTLDVNMFVIVYNCVYIIYMYITRNVPLSIWLSCHQAIHTEIFTGQDSPMDKW